MDVNNVQATIMKFVDDNDHENLKLYLQLVGTLDIPDLFFQNFDWRNTLWKKCMDIIRINVFKEIVIYCSRDECKDLRRHGFNIFAGPNYSIEYLKLICDFGKIDHDDQIFMLTNLSSYHCYYTYCFPLSKRLEKIKYLLKTFTYSEHNINQAIIAVTHNRDPILAKPICNCNDHRNDIKEILNAKLSELQQLNQPKNTTNRNDKLRNIMYHNVRNNCTMEKMTLILDFIAKLDVSDKKYIMKSNCADNFWVHFSDVSNVRNKLLQMVIEFCIEHDCWDTESQLCRFSIHGTAEQLKILHDIGKITTDMKNLGRDSYYRKEFALSKVRTSEQAKYLLENYTYTIEELLECKHASKNVHIDRLIDVKIDSIKSKTLEFNQSVVIRNQNTIVLCNSDGTLEHWTKA